MAFIIPIVLLNEYNQARVRRQLGTIATKLGATIVKGERMVKTTRLSEDGIFTEAAGLEVVSTAKSVQRAKIKQKKEKEKTQITKSTKSVRKDKDQKTKKEK